jgi:hypothetical protein
VLLASPAVADDAVDGAPEWKCNGPAGTHSIYCVRELLSRYNCAWVREQRKIYSDDELRAMAKELHLPDVVVRMAERCPR